MAWVLLVVVLALVAGYLIITFGYRTSVLVLIAVLVLGIATIVWYAEFHQAPRSDRIKPDEVVLNNFKMVSTYGSSYQLIARIRNLSSDFTLTAVELELSARDCPTPEESEDCVIVGQQKQNIQIRVPPQQGRDITRQLIFPTMRPDGELVWGYSILSAKAQK